MYKYSIIMPVYNSMKFLHRSIKSIINQSYKNWELIIIDDGSTDESLKILQEYSQKDERIQVYHQDNVGPGRARNYGIKKCNGDYVAFIDADDYYEDDLLELINKENVYEPQDLIFISTINERTDGTKLNCDNLIRYSNNTKYELLSMQMIGVIPWGPCSKIVKSEIIKKCCFSDLSVGEEAIYSFEVLNYSEKYKFIEKPLYHYVHNDNGQHTKGGYDPWGMVVENMKTHIINIGDFAKYEKSINGLALKSVSIAIYRYSCDLEMKKALIEIKNKVESYKMKYDFNKIDLKQIDKSLKIILICIKFKFYIPLIIASRLRKKVY